MSVYSAEAIAAGHIPQEGAHQQAANFILDELFPPGSYREDGTDDWLSAAAEHGGELLPESSHGVELAMVYGSTTTYKADMRSDVDVLFVYDVERGTSAAFPAINRAINGARQRHWAPIQPHILTRDALHNALHHRIDNLFVEHLLEVERERPMWMRPPTRSIASLESNVAAHDSQDQVSYATRRLAIRYCASKQQRFADAGSLYDGRADLSAMDTALKLPSAIGRKVLVATKQPSEVLPHISEKHQMTANLIAKLELWAPSWHPEAAAQARRLDELNRTYDAVLRQAVDGDLDLPDYTTWIQTHYLEAVKKAHDLTSACIDIISSEADRGPVDIMDWGVECEASDGLIEWSN